MLNINAFVERCEYKLSVMWKLKEKKHRRFFFEMNCILINFFTNLYWTLYFTINFIAIKFFVCNAYWAHP